MTDADRCAICGKVIPEGIQVCPICNSIRYDMKTEQTARVMTLEDVDTAANRRAKEGYTVEELKSCPFCGSMPQLCYCDASGSTYTKNPATIYYGKRMTHKAYVCLKCGIRTKPYATDKGVWKAWNHRAAPIAPEEYEGTFYCGVCHETINSGDKYCHECGKAVKWDG